MRRIRKKRRCQSTANQSQESAKSALSGHQLTPFGQCGRSDLLEENSSVEVSLEVEMVVDRGAIGSQAVRYNGPRPAVAFHRSFEELQRSPAIPAFCGENSAYLALVIHRTPEMTMRLAIDPDEGSVKQWMANIHHNREANYLGRRVEITEGTAHRRRLRKAIPQLKLIYSDGMDAPPGNR